MLLLRNDTNPEVKCLCVLPSGIWGGGSKCWIPGKNKGEVAPTRGFREIPVSRRVSGLQASDGTLTHLSALKCFLRAFTFLAPFPVIRGSQRGAPY